MTNDGKSTDTKKNYWLKMARNYMNRHDIKILRAMGGPDRGARITLLYISLLLESIDHDGSLRFSDKKPYTPELLAAVTGEESELVKDALEIYESLGLIENQEDGTIRMTKLKGMVGSTSNSKDRVAEFREKRQEMEKHIPKIEPWMNNTRYGGNYYKAFERDGGACKLCGDTDRLYMHHIIAYDPDIPETTAIQNLITLCPSCHSKLHHNKKQADLPPEEILDAIGFNNDFVTRYKGLQNITSNLHLTQELELEKELEKETDRLKEKIQKEKTEQAEIERLKSYRPWD